MESTVPLRSKLDMENRIHVVLPIKGYTHTVILLHGRDSTASEFATEFFESQASDGGTLQAIFPSFKWVFPSAKIRTSARFQTDMSQWFDMWDLENPDERVELQRDGMRESGIFLDEVIEHEVIEHEAKWVPTRNILLGGISQGCATALGALLWNGKHKLGGFIGFSSWMPLEVGQVEVAKNKGTPVFIAHCIDDEVVPLNNGMDLIRQLEHHEMDVTWRVYPEGGHWINEPEGVDDIVAFIKKIDRTL